ncbi:MAG: oligosaccharide flippase family protein [Candidatus Omnitrophica bacterium]|nr:oligosaccharide flippase family protein [Candidatus Omnitrophota bacterium]
MHKERNKEEMRIIKETAAFSGANYFAQGLLMIRGFIIASVLGPALYGIWTIYRTFLSSAHFLSLGTTSAMVRQVPLEEGRGNHAAREKMQQATFAWNVLSCGVVSVILLVLSFLCRDTDRRIEFILAACAFFLNAFKIFMPFKFNSERKIMEMSRFNILYAIMNTVFGLILLFSYKINGLLVALIITNVILMVWMRVRGEFSLALNFDFTMIKGLMNIGFPIMVLYVAFFLMAHIDQFVIYFMLGKSMTGYYGLAAFISQIVHFIPYAIATVLMPRMMHKLGRTGETTAIEEYFTKPIMLLSGFLPIVFGLIFINIDSIIFYCLPKYIPSLTVLRILLVGLFFTSLLKVPMDILIAFNKQAKLLYVMIVLLAIGTIVDIVMVSCGYGIVGVAAATSVIFYAASLLTNAYVLRSFGKSWKLFGLALLRIHVPVAYVAIGLLYIMRFTMDGRIIITDVVRTIFFIIYIVPLIYYVNRKIRIIEKIGQLLSSNIWRTEPNSRQESIE